MSVFTYKSTTLAVGKHCFTNQKQSKLNNQTLHNTIINSLDYYSFGMLMPERNGGAKMMKAHAKPEEKPKLEKPKPKEDNNTEDFDLNNFIRKIAYDLYLAGEAPLENKSENGDEHGGVHTTSNAKNSGFMGTNDYSNTNVNGCNVDDFPRAMKTNSIDIGLKGILQTAQHLAEANEKGTNSTTQNATEEYVAKPLNSVTNFVANTNNSDDTISVAGGGHNGEVYYPNDTINTVTTYSSGDKTIKIFKGR